MENPCYNVKTKTDCPYRASGCAAGCKKWEDYVYNRNKEYEKRHKTIQAEVDMAGHVIRFHERFRRGCYTSNTTKMKVR